MEVLQAIGVVLGALLILAGAITTLGGAAEKIIKVVKAAKMPNEHQNERLDSLESHVKEIDGFLALDKKRLDAFESSTRVTQRALLALLEHGIDGNSVKRMQDSREELENHLINR